MFEPENDIERALVGAANDPAQRPAFDRALMEGELLVALIPVGGPLPTGPDGKPTVPLGTKLTIASVERGKDKMFPLFTSPARAREWIKGDHIVSPEKTRNLFERYAGVPFVLNPGSDGERDFGPDEVKNLLAGKFGDAAT